MPKKMLTNKSQPGSSNVHVNKPIGEEIDPRSAESLQAAPSNIDIKVIKEVFGNADNDMLGLYDMQNIVQGIDWEMAYANYDESVAEQIALDNLSNDPDYYKKKWAQAAATSDVLNKSKIKKSMNLSPQDAYNVNCGAKGIVGGYLKTGSNEGEPEEKFHFAGLTFDLNKAKKMGSKPNSLIEANPNWIKHVSIGDESKDNDTVLLGLLEMPHEDEIRPIVISGHEIIEQAIKNKKNTIPAHVFSVNETKELQEDEYSQDVGKEHDADNINVLENSIHQFLEEEKLEKDTQENEDETKSNWPVGLYLDLCSGPCREPGYVGIDLYKHDNGTIVHDLNLGIPAPDESVSKIRLVNGLEYMDLQDPKPLLSEIQRVLMPGGEFHYEGPNEIYNYPEWLDQTSSEDNTHDVEKIEGQPWFKQKFTRLAVPDAATSNDAEPRIGIAQYDMLPADALLAMDALGYYWSDSTSSGRGNRLHGYPSQGALLSRSEEEAANNAAVDKELDDDENGFSFDDSIFDPTDADDEDMHYVELEKFVTAPDEEDVEHESEQEEDEESGDDFTKPEGNELPNFEQELDSQLPDNTIYAMPDEYRYPIRSLKEALRALIDCSGRAEETVVKDAVYRKFPQIISYNKSLKSENRIKKSERIKKSLSGLVPVKKVDPYKQIVYCVVLTPDEVDAQEDYLTADDIEEAAHKYMINSRVIGKDHSEPIDAVPVESYIAPQDLTWEDGPYGPQVVKKGAWVLGIKINDPEEWKKVLDGSYQGVSVGGYGARD